jgi:hypothetical protein
MQEKEMRHVAIRVVLEESESGLLRFVGDVQRFGFRLNTLVLAHEKDGAPIVTAALSVRSIATLASSQPALLAIPT